MKYPSNPFPFSRKISELEWREFQVKSTIEFLEHALTGLTDIKLIQDLIKVKIEDLKISNPNPQ